MPEDETLGDDEIWTWACLGAASEDAAKSAWAALNATLGQPVGTANLQQVTNGLDSTAFGTFTTSPCDINKEIDHSTMVFVRAAKADGTIRAIGGVENVGKIEGTDEFFVNGMLGEGLVSTTYYAWDSEAKKLVLQGPVEAIRVTNATTALEDGQWYVITSKSTFNQTITVSGSAHLICWPSSDITFSDMTLAEGATLSVYGILDPTDPSIKVSTGNFSFGSIQVGSGVTLNVHGGNVHWNKLQCDTINAYGGAIYSFGRDGLPAMRIGSALTVYGGFVQAESTEQPGCAGIAGTDNTSGVTVRIYGGDVCALGGEGAPGIGAGGDSTTHGELKIGEGMHAWTFTRNGGRNGAYSEVLDYPTSRERCVEITASADVIRAQAFTVTRQTSNFLVTMPNEPGEGYRWVVVTMLQPVARADMGGGILAADYLMGYCTQLLEGRSLLNGTMGFADLTYLLDGYHLPYGVEYHTGATFELGGSVDAMLVCRVTDDDWSYVYTMGGITHLQNLSVTESKESEVTMSDDPAPEPEPVEATYYAWNGEEVTGPFTTNAIPVTAEMETLNSGWYVVNSVVSNFTGITVNGDAHLILADGAELYANGGDYAGICVNVDADDVTNSISIYGQANKTGKLIAIGGEEGAGIGAQCTAAYISVDDVLPIDCGVINVHGGDITAISECGSGIGSFDRGENHCGNYGGTITIYGGRVNAVGGTNGAGIGSTGYSSFGEYDDAPSCRVTIYDGEITAGSLEELTVTGIGGGMGRNGGIVTIYNGTVQAVGVQGAGIGGGFGGAGGDITIQGGNIQAQSLMGAGIGGGLLGEGGTVTINGGTVNAVGLPTVGGDEEDPVIYPAGAGIGGGLAGAGGTVTVNGGEVTAISYPIDMGEGSGVVQGEGIGAGYNLTDPTTSLDPGTLDMDGYETTHYIYAGMDTNGVEVTEVQAGDYATVWHTNCYVQITATKRPEPVASDWAKLQQALTNDAAASLTCDAFEHTYENGTNFVKLLKDVAADAEFDTCLVIASGSRAVLDLNGQTLDRGLGDLVPDGAEFEEFEGLDDGHVIRVVGHLTVTDTSEAHDGKITGGCGVEAGGVYVYDEQHDITQCSLDQLDPSVEYARFVLVEGSIVGNVASDGESFGGVSVSFGAEFIMLGGRIANNVGVLAGGVGILAENARRGEVACRVDLRGGVISGNKGYGSGAVGMMAQGNEYEAISIGGTVVITNNIGVYCGGVLSTPGLTLGGSPVIKNNGGIQGIEGAPFGAHDLFFCEWEDVYTSPAMSATEPLTDGADIGVGVKSTFEFLPPELPVKFLTNASETSAQYFHSEIAGTRVFFKDDALWIEEGDSAAEGSPENPWDVGTNGNGQPAAYTNGNNEVVVTGEGLPKPYGGEGDPAPWAGFDPEIETIYVPQNTEDIYKHQWPDDAEKIVGVPDYLSFTAKDGDVYISYCKTYDGVYGLEYSFDPIAEDWSELKEITATYDDIAYGLTVEGDKVLVPNGQTLYVRKAGNEVKLSMCDSDQRARFSMSRVDENGTATVEAGGNVMSLLDQTCRSKEVGEYAFSMLFGYCSILTTAPKLPATKLDSGCYEDMFYYCAALEVAPELPVTQLSAGCYRQMFSGCSALKKAPELPARELAHGCYDNMFFGCGQLNYIKVGFDVWPTDSSCESWLKYVAETGTFVCSQALDADFAAKGLEYGDSTIPEGWRFARDYLSFTAKGGDITLTLNKVGNPGDVAFEFSSDAGKSWTYLPVGGPSFKFAENSTVYIRKKGDGVISGISKDFENYLKFSFDGDEGATVAAGGNVMSLLDPTCQSRMIGEYGLYSLFGGCDRLVSAPRIDADVVMRNGCEGMFTWCTSLTTAPFIGAGDKFESYAFCSMFSNAGALNEMTVGFTNWVDFYRAAYWVQNVAPFGVFRCPSELPIQVDESHIPVGWIVFKKFSIPAIEGLSHSVTNSAGEVIAPSGVSQDGTKTYEVAAGGDETYAVYFEDDDGYPAVGKNPLDLGNLSDSVEIGSDKYPLPERGVQLTVEGAPAHSKFTIYCGEEVFAEGGADNLTTRVSPSVMTKVVYSTTDEGWAYAFEDGQPVKEKLQLEDCYVTNPTEVSAPTELPDNYAQVWDMADAFGEYLNGKIDDLMSYPTVVQNEGKAMKDTAMAVIDNCKANPLPSSEKLAELENEEADFDEKYATLEAAAQEFVEKLQDAAQRFPEADAELKALGATDHYEAQCAMIIAEAEEEIAAIQMNGDPPTTAQIAALDAEMNKFEQDFEKLKDEAEAFLAARTVAQAGLDELQTNFDGLMNETQVAAKWAEMQASQDPNVVATIAATEANQMALGLNLSGLQTAIDNAQEMKDIDDVSNQMLNAGKSFDALRSSIVNYQIPQYLLRVPVSVANSNKLTYSVYTGETAQVTIVADANETNEYHYVWETPVKVVYKLVADGWAFDAASDKNVKELVVLDDMMFGDRLLAEPPLGNLKDLEYVYESATNQFDAWEKEAEQMPEHLKNQIDVYVSDARALVDARYENGVPVDKACYEINQHKDAAWAKIEPLFAEGYFALAQERGIELQQKYDQFFVENGELIDEIGQYGTPESEALVAQIDMLLKDYDDFVAKIGAVNNKAAYEELLNTKQKIEEQMEDLAKQLAEAIRYITALPISADRDFYGNVFVRSFQQLSTPEQHWICLWCPNHAAPQAIWLVGEIIGRKFREVLADELLELEMFGAKADVSYGWSLGTLSLPENMTACVIAAVDEQGNISRVGYIGDLGALAPGEVKGTDVTGVVPMKISYYESKQGELYPREAMARPLTGDGPVELDVEVSRYYAVLGDCEVQSLTVKGIVTLVLGRGCDFSVVDGIFIEEGGELRIYSEHDFRYEPHLTGRMTIEKTGIDPERPAAICGDPNSTLEIHGGVIDIASATAGIKVGQFFMLNGDVTVAGDEGYAGVDLSGGEMCEVDAGTLNVTGGAGAAAIGGNIGQCGGTFRMTFGGIVRADATPTDGGICGAGIGAGAGADEQGVFDCPIGKLTVFSASSATSKMKVDVNYAATRMPSVLITAGGELVQPLPFTLTKKGNYELQLTGDPRSQYVTFALTKDDLARAYGEGSTVGAEIWQMVSQIATGARVAVGEITRASLERSFREMGIKTVYVGYSGTGVAFVPPYGEIAMIVALDCDEQGRVVRLGGVNLPDSMTDGSSIESTIGREAIGALTFQAVGEEGKVRLQNLSYEPGEGESIVHCCYTKEKLAQMGVTEEMCAASGLGWIGREVGTAPRYFFSDMSDHWAEGREFDQGKYTLAFVLICDANDQVKRIGVVTGIETLADGQNKDSDAALIGAQSFTLRAETSNQAILQMPEKAPDGQAWLWVRVCDETKYEALDAFVNGLIGQPVGAAGATLRPLDASAMPATFGSGNWGLFTGESVWIDRLDAKTGNPMRGVVVFKVLTLPMSETGSELAILTAGGVKNVDKLTDGQTLSNRYGEDVERIVNQPLTVTRMGDDAQSLWVEPEGELPEGGNWLYLTISPDSKFDESPSERLLAYLGAAVGDLTVNTLGGWGLWLSSTIESSFTVPGDTEAVYLFKVDANGNILSIGLADGLTQLYETGMSKGDTFGKTFIAAQDFGVTCAGEALTATVYGWDAFEAEKARDRFVCFTYADANVAGDVYNQLANIVNGTAEVGVYTLANLGGEQPTIIGTFATDELSLELPAGCSTVFVARVHGADDTIVTLGGVPTGDVADGETRRPGEDAGFNRVRPFGFSVMREENGTFTLEASDERRPNEQWLWAAVPSHVRYVMEQQFESSERLLALLRREMVEASAGSGKPTGKSEFIKPETLQMLLGEGYYGTSLDTTLFVGDIPADTEVVLVFKIDRATGNLCSEGAVIGLDQLATSEAKQNQVDGKVSYVAVDADGNRTEMETTVEPITALTTSIGGGRWYVMTELPTSVGGQEAVTRITVDGEANIVLLDNLMGGAFSSSEVVLNGGFAVNEGATLNIYGQQMGNGMMHVYGADGCAAIGGDEGCGCGTVNIHGGVVLAEAGVDAAAIGGGYLNGGVNGTVNLYGGIVMAAAGEAAAIGGGRLGCGCTVTIGAAATVFCAGFGEEEPIGVGGCDGLANGEVTVHGGNRVYLEADEAFVPHPYDYYFGDVRRGNFVTTQLLTVSLPKDERLTYNVTSLTLGGDFGGVLPGDDACTYKVLRGDTIVVTAITADEGLLAHGFRSPNVFKFDCVQSDVTVSADDLKVAPKRAVTPMDFTVSRDRFGNVSLRVNETFAPGEQLVYGVIPEGANPPLADEMIAQLFDSPVTFLYMLLGQNLSVGEAGCDEYALMLGAKNWNIAFDYAGEEIPLPANARHVLAFKVYDAGRYAALAQSGKKILKGMKKKSEGRLAVVKIGAVENLAEQLGPGESRPNQVTDGSLIVRQPFALTRNEDETFQLTPVGRLDAHFGEKWGYATLNDEGLAAIESGVIEGLTLDTFKLLLDCMIGRSVGAVSLDDLQEFAALFSQFETFEAGVVTCPKDTVAVIAFKTRMVGDKGGDKGGDAVCAVGYTFGDLQAMAPGGTERKGDEIDGEVDAPTYFVTVENIPDGVKKVTLTYSFGETKHETTISADVSPEGTAQFAVPEGVNVEIEFEEPSGYIFRTKNSVKIKAIHQDELVDASFLVLADRNRIEPQHFILRRNADKTFAMEMPEYGLDAEKGDRWFYLALNANDMAMSFSDEQPAGAAVWLLANQMIGQEVGSSDLLTTTYFMNAVRNGYSGYTAERFFGLPADAEMVIVCRCFDVTAEDGFTITYVETVGGCQNLQQTGEYDVRDEEMNYPSGGEMFKVNYVKWDKSKSTLVPGGTVVARVIDDDMTTIGNGEWYVVPPMEEVTCGTITVQGTANVIVGDMATFELDNFVVGEGATLNVYGQGQRLGTMIVGGDGVSIGSGTACGTINLHGVTVMVEGEAVGIGGMSEGGELNVLGANMLVMAYGPAIAGCTVNAYGGRVLAASMSGGDYPAINDGLAIKNSKMGLFASANPAALEPTKVADYLENRQPFAKIVEQVNIILPKVEHAKVTVAAQDVITRDLSKFEPEDLPGADWLIYKVERFDNVMVEIAAESGYELRSPAEYLFYSIDSDKQLPADAIVVAESNWPPTQFIERQPFSIFRETDGDGSYCVLKPVGELGPGERWFWMSCDRTLAQTTGTVDGFKDATTEEAVIAMLNQAIGQAPVGYLSLDEYGLRTQLPVNQSGVGTDATFRLPADTDLVLLSKVYDGGLQDEGMVRYFNITLGLSTNLTVRMEGGDSGHNDIGEEPTEEEIKNALEDAFPDPHEVTQNEDGSFRITLMEDMTGPVAIPDNLGEIVLDMNGFHITGTNGFNGADGGNALVFTDSGDVGSTTELTIVEAGEKYNPEGDIVGGNGADGKKPGKGGAAIRVDTKRGVTINVEGTVLVIGGKGGTLLDGDKGTKPGDPGRGIDPQDTRGDRAPGSVDEGEWGEELSPWAKATLAAEAPDNLQTRLPEGVTMVGNELWFWKRTTGEFGGMIGFDFRTIEMNWLDDRTIRFAAGTYLVDQFTYGEDGEIVFVGADSAAVVVEDAPFTPVKPEEKPDKPVLEAVVVGNKGPELPDLGKYTVLVSTGKSIFKAVDGRLDLAVGPLGKSARGNIFWRNLGFTALPGTVIEVNGGAINAENVDALMVADCAFAGLTAGQLGGAIYAVGLGKGGLITNSTFTACSVDPASGLGGAIYAVGGRAPLLAAGPLGKKAEPAPLTVADCVFTLNEAESGGAICTSPMDALEDPIALEIVRSTFNGNTAEYNGGAICAVGKVTIADAEAGRGTFFAYNEAGIYGGALAIDGIEDAHVDNEVFVGSNTLFACNRAENDWFGEALGGAINLPADCTLAVRNAMFTNNVAACTGDVNVYGAYGGAICTASGCSNVIEKTYFLDNRAIAGGSTGDRYACGGALSDVDGELTFVDTCVFDGNLVEGQAAVGAALDLEYDAESAVVNSTFRRSNVEAISAYATPVVIRNCVVVDNGAEADIWIEEASGYELTFTAYGSMYTLNSSAAASSDNLGNCTAAEVYRGETVYLATNVYNKVAALGYPQPGVTDIEGVEYGSKFWGTSMGAFETPAIYPVEELGFEITVDPLELAWTGMKVHPTSVAVTNPFTRVELREGVDYTVSFENDVDSTDKALVIVTGIGDYSGTATTNYWITSYLVRYYACEKSEGDVDDYDRLLEEVELGSLNGSNVVAKIAPPAGYVLDPFHEGTLTNGTVTLYDSMVVDEVNGRLLLKVYYAKSSGGDDDIPDKYQRKITYKVVNGWWDDPDNGLDRTVWVTLLNGDGNWSETGTGTLEDIPTVGNTPFTGYAKAGVWYPAEPSVSEMTISREYPAIPFFLYVYCPQPQGGSGRGGRGGTSTAADVDALRNHLQTRFTINNFAVAGGLAQMGAKAAVVNDATGQTLAEDSAAGMTLKVLGTADLSSGEWAPVANPVTDGNGQFSFELPEGANQQFFQIAPAGE